MNLFGIFVDPNPASLLKWLVAWLFEAARFKDQTNERWDSLSTRMMMRYFIIKMFLNVLLYPPMIELTIHQ